MSGVRASQSLLKIHPAIPGLQNRWHCAFAGSNPVSPHNDLFRGDIQVAKGGGPIKMNLVFPQVPELV